MAAASDFLTTGSRNDAEDIWKRLISAY